MHNKLQNIKEINLSLDEFKKLLEDKIITISKIQWWLIKYNRLINDSYSISNEHKTYNDTFAHCFCDDCLNSLPRKYFKFCTILEEIVDLQKSETYCKEQLEKFKIISLDKNLIKQWLIQNESLANEKLICFLLDYLDYDVDHRVHHLKMSQQILKNTDIFIERYDFKYMIEYLMLFNDLFYVKMYYKEGLDKIELSMLLQDYCQRNQN